MRGMLTLNLSFLVQSIAIARPTIAHTALQQTAVLLVVVVALATRAMASEPTAAITVTFRRTRGVYSRLERPLRKPIAGITGCCARAANGQAAAAMPSSVMNSRRFMGCPPQTGGRTLPHRYAKTLLCITAKLIVEWQRWVKRVTSVRSQPSRNVRYASNTDRIDASQHRRKIRQACTSYRLFCPRQSTAQPLHP